MYPWNHRTGIRLHSLQGRGQFCYKVMPQGFVNAPSVFSRLMNLAMRGLNWLICLCFIDDVIVFAKTFDETLANLEAVLQRFVLLT